MKRLVLVSCVCAFMYPASGQYWQQQVKYKMDIDVDVRNNTFTGKQQLEYTNNSPDTLKKLFYHLYFNAFQPNSMMDVRSRHMGTIRTGNRQEWDPRVKERIAQLKPEEVGYHKINSFTLNGTPQKFTVRETILQVDLSRPIAPGAKVVLSLDFNSQVPKQIRRSGRDAANGVRYSMSQWYPKIAEYDEDGWHPNPYVGREFYGVWGDFDVKITIDKNYLLGGTGYLQNAQQIGFGYESQGTKPATRQANKLTWHFVAPNVHDFMWAADPDYKHTIRRIDNGPLIHVIYKNGEESRWKEIGDAIVAVYPFVVKNFGAYPYKQYTFIQGGDGAMEYPMATLLNGPTLGSAIHEFMHSWYQGMLATDESRYAWMDEGFTEWATDKVQDYYSQVVIRNKVNDNPSAMAILDSMQSKLPRYHSENYEGYMYLAQSGLEEPLTTHADHFETNTGYSLAAYSKGAVFLAQLGYIAGDETLHRIMLEYYRQWRFKHPDTDDFLRVAEKVSGLHLDWYKDYWVNSTKTIDYGIDSLWEEAGKTNIRLKRIGTIPMPIDLMIEYKDGTKEMAYIPAYLMFGSKPPENNDTPRKEFEPWKWTHDTYTVELDKKIATLKVIEIDSTQRMADVEIKNNRLVIPW
jgi:hypothetical protein